MMTAIPLLIAMSGLLAMARLIRRLREDRDHLSRSYERLKEQLYRLRNPDYWQEDIEDTIPGWLLDLEDAKVLEAFEEAGVRDPPPPIDVTALSTAGVKTMPPWWKKEVLDVQVG